MKQIKRTFANLVYFILFALFVTSILMRFFNQTNFPKPERGFLDLSSYSFGEDTFSLDGEWEFYWNQYLDYYSLGSNKPDKYANVPGSWDAYTTGYGFATYRIHVKTNQAAGSQMGLYFREISCAYDVYINNKLVASQGKTADTAEAESGVLDVEKVTYFINPASEFDIIIHISNFQFANGGIIKNIYLGTEIGIQRQYRRSLLALVLFSGGMLISLAHSLFTASINKNNKYFYFLALMIVFGFFRNNFMGSALTEPLFGRANLQIYAIYRYSAFAWSLFSVTAYYCLMFRMKHYRKYIIAALIISSLSQLYVIITTLKYKSFIYIGSFNLISVFPLSLITIILVMAVAGSKNADRLKKFSMSGLLLLAILILIDTILVNSSTKYYSSFIAYFLFFFIIQMFNEANRSKQEYEQLVKSQTSLLQAQEKPRYLFQTINAIVAVSESNLEKACSMLFDFSELLRSHLDLKGINHFVRLDDEIRLTESYLCIQKEYYRNGFNYRIEYPENTDITVPAYMLTPIVEFVMLSRTASTPSIGRTDLTIVVSKAGKKLSFDVTTVEVKRLQNNSQYSTQSDNIGINNLAKRLELLYGRKIPINVAWGNEIKVSWVILARSIKAKKVDLPKLKNKQKMFR